MEVIDCIKPDSHCVNANPRAFSFFRTQAVTFFRRVQIVLDRFDSNEFNFPVN